MAPLPYKYVDMFTPYWYGYLSKPYTQTTKIREAPEVCAELSREALLLINDQSLHLNSYYFCLIQYQYWNSYTLVLVQQQ